jgi:hypothetical protein
MQLALAANIALKLLGEYVASTGDQPAEDHYNALVSRLQAVEAEQQRQATTAIDDDGNITIGLKTLSMSGQVGVIQ